MLKVGIIGVGTDGNSVANIWRDNKNNITTRTKIEIVLIISLV